MRREPFSTLLFFSPLCLRMYSFQAINGTKKRQVLLKLIHVCVRACIHTSMLVYRLINVATLMLFIFAFPQLNYTIYVYNMNLLTFVQIFLHTCVDSG